MTVRDCVVAEPGWLIMEADESQVELRVAAHVSKDPVFIDAFQNDRDLHAYRARRIMKLTEEEWEALPKEVRKEKRQNAKAVNFGFLFKMKAPTFQKYALIQYGLELSMTECVEFERGFYNDHIGLITYYERQEREALRNGYVENPIGRRRHLPNIKQDQSSREQRGKYNEAVRQAINSPIQSFASDLKLMSMLEIDKNIDPGEAYIFGEIHDSILLCVREDCVDRVGKMVLDVMSHPALLDTFGVEVIVPIKAELKVGPSLGEAKEYVPR
jgi:DNA polymerase-1